MSEMRLLIRLPNAGRFSPENQAALLAELRRRAAGLKGSIMNLRVSAFALEFDLFLPAGDPPEPFLEGWSTLGRPLTVRRLDTASSPRAAEAIIAEARYFFNEERFWEAHETLEELWKRSTGSEKQLVQGLILVAAAFVHLQRHERNVVPRMLQDALSRLAGQPSVYFGWDLDGLRRAISAEVSMLGAKAHEYNEGA
jgi:uncharacterized protein